MSHQFQFHVLLCSLILCTGASLLRAADVATDKLPPAADREINFDADIEPIFQKRCYACHGDDVEMNGYSLWRKKEAMLGGVLRAAGHSFRRQRTQPLDSPGRGTGKKSRDAAGRAEID